MSTSDGGNPWVIASSAFFFIPAAVALFRQSVVVAIIFFFAALFSTLYHVNDEDKYADADVFWASMATFIALVMLAVVSTHYAPWNWRVLLPVLFGVAGFVLYFYGGQASDSAAADTDTYALYHSLWHVFIGLAGLILSITPVDLSEASLSYGDLYRKVVRNGRERINERTLFR